MAKKESQSPFETRELRAPLKLFFAQKYSEPDTGRTCPISSYKWGVYIFYDYDLEPIYVGQSNEQVCGRIGRHLTNQRTDAVAMSVLDPFEVYEIEIYPLPQYQDVTKSQASFKMAKHHLDALESQVHDKAIKESKFGAILKEKDPPKPEKEFPLPPSLRGKIVSDEVMKLRGHSDTSTARRAQIIARLAQTISEREVQVGLRRTLLTQAIRLRWLTETRFKQMGGQSAIEISPEDGDN